MGLTSLVAAGGEHAEGTRWQRLLSAINRRRWALLVVLAALSALLLPLMEVEAVSDEYVYADRLVGDAAWWLRDGLRPLPAGPRSVSSFLAGGAEGGAGVALDESRVSAFAVGRERLTSQAHGRGRERAPRHNDGRPRALARRRAAAAQRARRLECGGRRAERSFRRCSRTCAISRGPR